MNFKDNIEKHSNLVLLSLLLINFTIRLIIYFNTTLFRFTDWRGYLDAIEKINAGEDVQLFRGPASFLNSYIGYYFKYILGSFDLYFIFNCLFGTLTVYIIYRIMRYLNVTKISSLIAVILLTFYTEFMAFSSIFYTPIIMVFLLSLTILFSLKFIKITKHSFFYAIALIFIISLSLLFKPVLKYVFGVYFILGVICFKRNLKLALKLVLLAVILLGITKTIEYTVISKNDPSKTERQFISFYGHTWYGGDGGKVTITYPEQQQLYEKNFNDFCKKNDITNPTVNDNLKFQNEHVNNFILNHPFSWMQLQWHKFFWEYGILPEANSFKILMTGLTKKHTVLTATIIVLPVVLFILLFIVSFDAKLLIYTIKKRPEMQFMGILFLYYIVATVFYFAYQERYRIPVMVCFLLPLLAINLTNFRLKLLLQQKKELIIKFLVILLFLTNWSYEAYVIGVKNRDRYLKTINATKEFKIGIKPFEVLLH